MCAVPNSTTPPASTKVPGHTTRRAACGANSSRGYQAFAAALRAIITKATLDVAGTCRADKPGYGHEQEEPNGYGSEERNGDPRFKAPT